MAALPRVTDEPPKPLSSRLRHFPNDSGRGSVVSDLRASSPGPDGTGGLVMPEKVGSESRWSHHQGIAARHRCCHGRPFARRWVADTEAWSLGVGRSASRAPG
jgi:hypothetical protein